MIDMIFLKPIFVEKVWGGTRLKDYYEYKLDSDNVGECWAISAHKNGDCEILNTEFRGYTLSKLYKERPELFGGHSQEEFPLMVKILDAKDDLSVQVHPDNEYSKRVENQYGKTECWYVLECDEGASIVMGHHARDKSEAAELIRSGKWDEFLNIIPIKNGDFFFVEPGTVHAIRKGTLIYELQQSSDVTYRLYDYNRLENGTTRELHIEKSIDVITAPQIFSDNSNVIHSEFVNLIECEYFSLAMINCNSKMRIELNDKYLLITAVDGAGTINGVSIKKGDSIILTNGNTNFELEGVISIMIAAE